MLARRARTGRLARCAGRTPSPESARSAPALPPFRAAGAHTPVPGSSVCSRPSLTHTRLPYTSPVMQGRGRMRVRVFRVRSLSPPRMCAGVKGALWSGQALPSRATLHSPPRIPARAHPHTQVYVSNACSYNVVGEPFPVPPAPPALPYVERRGSCQRARRARARGRPAPRLEPGALRHVQFWCARGMVRARERRGVLESASQAVASWREVSAHRPACVCVCVCVRACVCD